MQKQNHMHDPEFEKQMRQRMEELKFSPSETVWANLEKEIAKDKRRKRPLLWFSFFLVIALAGSFYFLLNTNNNHNRVIKNQSAKTSSGNEGQQPAVADDHAGSLHAKKDDHIQTNKSSSTPLSETGKTTLSKNKKNIAGTGIARRKGMNQKNKNIAGVEEDFLATNKLSKDKKIRQHVITHNKKNVNDAIKNEIVADALSADNEQQTTLNDTVKTQDAGANGSLVIGKTDSVAKKEINANKATAKNSADKNKKSTNKKSWEFGFTGGAGLSSVFENLFSTAVVGNPAIYNQSYAISAPPPIIPAHYTASNIRAGFSFSAGFLVQKAISKKFTFSAGLNYHYSSTKTQSGHKVDSFLSVNTTNALVRTFGYYRGNETHDYTNHYHLLELPVSVSYQFIHNKKFPLFWEAGAIVSQLISSDALHFDNSTGAYFKDNSLFNKTQFNAATSVMIGLHVNKNLYFQAGPQVQYGITNLLSSDAGRSQHLFFGGIKIVFIPNKK
jgi:hypothetical protein